MSTEKVHFQMKMFGIADRSVNGRIEGQKVQNSRLDSYQWRKAPTLLIKLKGEVDVRLAVQQIVEVQAQSFQMHGVDLEVSPVEGAVGIVMVDLAFALRILCPLNGECNPAVGAKFPASVLLPGR